MNEDLIKQEFVRGEYRKGYPGHFRGAIPDRHRKGVYLCHLSDSGRTGAEPCPGTGGMDAWCGVLPAGCSAPYTTPFTASGFPGGGWSPLPTSPLYIRFLDMKKHGNYGIYNRQVWGILWNNSLQTIKYGYGKGGPRPYLCRITGSFPKNGNTYGFLKTHCPLSGRRPAYFCP